MSDNNSTDTDNDNDSTYRSHSGSIVSEAPYDTRYDNTVFVCLTSDSTSAEMREPHEGQPPSISVRGNGAALDKLHREEDGWTAARAIRDMNRNLGGLSARSLNQLEETVRASLRAYGESRVNKDLELVYGDGSSEAAQAGIEMDHLTMAQVLYSAQEADEVEAHDAEREEMEQARLRAEEAEMDAAERKQAEREAENPDIAAILSGDT